jgi:hypothetical protein
MAAARHEDQDDVVAGDEVGDAVAQLLDDAGGFVPEHHRQGTRAIPLITERSEWHNPAASIFTSTSPYPGGARSSSSIVSGRVLA